MQLAALTPTSPAPTLLSASEHTGTVLWYKAEKGYGFGFITDDAKPVQRPGQPAPSGPSEVFVHSSALEGVKELHEGERVSFTLRPGPKGEMAWGVKLLTSH